MPGPSWSITAYRCITGGQLRDVPGSACSTCYALRGRMVMGQAHKANEFRYRAYLEVENWVSKMAHLITLSVSVGDPYFRWFSSGDLQSVEMLEDIIAVCRLTPNVQHWLPTQERDFVRRVMEDTGLPGRLQTQVTWRY